MNFDRSNDRAKKEDDLRILTGQVDHLRRELEDVTRRHHAVIYSVAWHAAWPIRQIERLFRYFFPKPDPFPAMPPDLCGAQEAMRADAGPPPIRLPLSEEEVADRIQSRMAAQS